MMKRLREHLGILVGKTHIPVWLAVLLGVIIILRIPSLFEPFYYGDETIYLTLGQGIKKGLILYQQIHDNKPPLLYLTAALAGNVFWFKSILMIWSLLTTTMFWHLAKVLLGTKEKIIRIATIIFGILTTIPLFEGNIANAENFMIGPVIVAIFLLLRKTPNIKTLLISGSLFSVAALYKIPAAFDLPAVILYWLIINGFNKQGIVKTIKDSVFLVIGFIIPIALSFIYFIAVGSGKEYLIAAFLQNFGYLSSWREGSQGSSLLKNLPLLIRASVVIIGTIVLFLKRKALSKEFIFICLWLLTGLFGVALSERPYPHYFLQVIPEVSLLIGILVADKTIKQGLVVIPLLLAFMVPVIYKFWYYPTTVYYGNFVKFALGITSRTGYFSGFGKTVNQNYEIANFIESSTAYNDKVFVWGPDSPNIYALSRRLPPSKYVADYHFFDYADIKQEALNIINAKPVFVIILPRAKAYPDLTNNLRKNYYQINEIEGAEIWRLRTVKSK